jgi:hypothetical protein
MPEKSPTGRMEPPDVPARTTPITDSQSRASNLSDLAPNALASTSSTTPIGMITNGSQVKKCT